MTKTLLFRVGAISLGLALILGLAVTGAPAQAQPNVPSAGLSTARAEDPVEVVGSALPDLAGAPIAELALYAFNGSTWAPIPFQIDERDGSNTYVASEDGLLDANDVLVFMARDAGSAAGLAEWPVDAQARVRQPPGDPGPRSPLWGVGDGLSLPIHHVDPQRHVLCHLESGWADGDDPGLLRGL